MRDLGEMVDWNSCKVNLLPSTANSNRDNKTTGDGGWGVMYGGGGERSGVVIRD